MCLIQELSMTNIIGFKENGMGQAEDVKAKPTIRKRLRSLDTFRG